MRQVLKRICFFFFFQKFIRICSAGSKPAEFDELAFSDKNLLFWRKFLPAVGHPLLPGGAAVTSGSQANKLWATIPREHSPARSAPHQGPRAAFTAGQQQRGAALQAARSFISPAAGGLSLLTQWDYLSSVSPEQFLICLLMLTEAHFYFCQQRWCGCKRTGCSASLIISKIAS